MWIMKKKKSFKRKEFKNEDAMGWKDELGTKCRYCRGKLYIKIFKNSAFLMQIGLYCSKCNKWHSFINEDDVFYYVGCKCRIVNQYGDLSHTKLNQLRYVTDLNRKELK